MRGGVSEYGRGTLLAHSLRWQVIGLLLMVSHVLLVRVSLAFYPLVILLTGWLYARASLAAVLVFFQMLLYQNLIISIFDQNIDPVSFAALQGTNFFVLMTMALVAGMRLLPRRQEYQAIFISITVALSFALIYTMYGTTSAGVASAAAYFRSFTGTALAAIVGLDTGRIWSFRTVAQCLIYAAVLSLLLSLFEYFYPVDYYTLTNAVRFLQLKYWNDPTGNTFYTPSDIIRHFTSVFFNISGSSHNEYGSDNFRYGGTIMNPISNAYILGVLSVVAVALKRSEWLLLLLPMLILAGAKGAAILLIASLLLYWYWVAVHNRRMLVVGALGMAVLYVGGGIISGLGSGDFHVFGFLGGVHSLLHVPLGHGIGVGGNLSAKAHTTRLQTEAAFANVDFALESAVGVLLYQMGAASVAILGVIVTFLYQAPLGQSRTFALPRRSDIIFFALGTITLNGVFQEEAYAPYASGLIMLLAAILVGNARRMGEVLLPTRRLTRYLNRQTIATGVAVCLVLLTCARAWAVPADRLQTLAHGANISTLFERNTDLATDIDRIARAGFQHVRVFVLIEDLDDPAYLQRVDRLVSETTVRHIGLILCMSSKTILWTDQTDVTDRWLAGWRTLARRLRASSARYVFPELANEPGLTDSERWDRIQSHLLQAVRAILPQHTILLTGSPTSMVWSLVEHPVDVRRDDNIAYTFHLYQPMAVTCQGCECCPADEHLAGLEYPPNQANIRAMTNPETVLVLETYSKYGAVMMRRELAAAEAWSRTHDVPVLATEFGVFSAASQQTRAAWLSEARSGLEAAHIGWTVWEWEGGFGVAPLHPGSVLSNALGLSR
jgi:hypothetical protein